MHIILIKENSLKIQVGFTPLCSRSTFFRSVLNGPFWYAYNASLGACVSIVEQYQQPGIHGIYCIICDPTVNACWMLTISVVYNLVLSLIYIYHYATANTSKDKQSTGSEYVFRFVHTAWIALHFVHPQHVNLVLAGNFRQLWPLTEVWEWVKQCAEDWKSIAWSANHLVTLQPVIWNGNLIWVWTFPAASLRRR